MTIVIRRLYLLVLALFATGCASNQGLVHHSFQFDLANDNQDAELLDYRYGDSLLPVSPPEWAIKEGRAFYFQSVHGVMRRGDSLYAKWRILSSKQICEDTVDLRTRLPQDIKDHTLTLMIRGPQLYIYLVTPNPIPKGESPNGPRVYRDRKVITLYPDPANR